MRTELSAGMSMLAFATVADLPVRDVARVSVDTPMWQVVQEMKAKNRGCVLVVDEPRRVEGGGGERSETGALVGIFTERDLLNRVDHSDLLWSHATVGDLMTPMPMVIHGDDSLAEAMRRLTQGRRRHLPIVDERGRVVGLMSIRDILSYIAGKFPEELMNLPPDPSHEA